jgi:hypothetical protein
LCADFELRISSSDQSETFFLLGSILSGTHIHPWTDRLCGTPYFYLVVMVGVPVTLFFPSTSRVSSVVPLAIWAVIYLILLLSIKRTHSTTSYDLSVILLELVLLEIGIWFAYQMASQLGQAESLMDAVALASRSSSGAAGVTSVP